MAKKSGVPVENIASIAGVSAISITRLVGVATLDIGGWPTDTPPPPSCDTLLLGYTDGRELPPTAACSADFMPYELDPLTNILYTEGGCGDERSLAPGGFYSDGRMVYSIGPEGTFIEVRPCEG